MRLAAPALVVVFAVASHAASSQDIEKKSDNSRRMVVQGCVNGSVLDVHHDDLGRGGVSSPYDHFKLRGNKDLMKVLTKDLRGHLVEVSGLMDDPAGKQGGGKTIQVGKKSTVSINDREVSTLPDPASDPILTVDAYKDLQPHCSGK
jgi:hypothetical protein